MYVRVCRYFLRIIYLFIMRWFGWLLAKVVGIDRKHQPQATQ